LQFSSDFFYHFFIIFLSFSIIFHHFSSIPPLEAKMMKKMIKNEKKTRKIAFFHFLENCNFPRVFFSFFSFFFHFFIIFLSFSIIFHHFSSIPPLEAKMIKMIKKMIKK